MSKIAVIKTGGKQYLVKEGDVIYVEKIEGEKGSKVSFETLAIYDEKEDRAEIGEPVLKAKVEGEILDQVKADKIRTIRFKAKVRYRRIKGHRQPLTKVKIMKIS